MSKSQRVLQVLEVVEALGRGTPRDIQYKVAMRTAVDPEDANFKRNIYRDLRELTDQGQLNVYYFLPDGTAVDSDTAESHKNIRIEYALSSGSDEKILGWKSLETCGFQFIASQRNRMLWKAEEIGSAFEVQNYFSILIRLLNGQVLALKIAVEDLPAKILVGRKGDFDEKKLLAELEEREGIRATYLMSSNPAISRYVPKERLGHCKITVDSQKRVKVTDLKSASGTLIVPIPEEKLIELWQGRDDLKTTPLLAGHLEENFSANQIQAGSADTAVSSPSAIKLGAGATAMTLFLVVK